MKDTKIRVPEDFKQNVVNCINKVFTDDLPRYLSEFQPNTHNGVPHNIGDWIHTNICDMISSQTIDVI